MKKKEKGQILSLIESMERANQILVSLLVKGDIDRMTKILADEQEAAISIGSRVEQLENESAGIVEIFEEYCELLWRITQDDITRKRADIERLVTLIDQGKKAIEALENTEMIDVVFLPYNASMWDSMETVWKAAKGDPSCRVSVVPIPYYDLNPDGTKNELHYEGNLLPGYVSVTSYKEYDITKEYPDIVYIHNPYDEFNKVTRVHPDYYSSVLRNYTDMLVYIPYYITDGHLPETHNYLPAYIYADKIILQDEAMLDEIAPNVPKEKLLPIGSPKAERLIWMETHKNQIDFPAEWIRKAKGKKVFFYNISINGLLKHREEILDKMEEVFRNAASNKKILLLWRPHPLLEATLASMCPELLERYQQLMRWFKKKNIGILDKTPDPDKGVVFADAYIGESSSSIVSMFRTVNKPLMYLSQKKIYQPSLEEMYTESITDICKVGNELWFIAKELQVLCKCCMEDGHTEVVADIPESPAYIYNYESLVYYENKVILIPCRAEALCIYDIVNGEFQKHYFKDEYVSNSIGRAILYKHYLFLTPRNYSAIIRYDILTGEFKYFKQCIIDMLQQMDCKKQGSPFVWAVSSFGEELFMGSTWSNLVLCFNMETFEYRIFPIGNSQDVYLGIAADSENTWFMLKKNPKVVKWNRKTESVSEYKNFPEDFEQGEQPYKNIIEFESVIYLIPQNANYICQLDKQTGKITKSDFNVLQEKTESDGHYFKRPEGKFYFGKKISEKEMIAFSLVDNSIVRMNVIDKSHSKIPLHIENYLYWELRKNYENVLEIIESQRCTFSQFIEYVTLELIGSNFRCGAGIPEMDQNSCTGKRIHECIKCEII